MQALVLVGSLLGVCACDEPPPPEPPSVETQLDEVRALRDEPNASFALSKVLANPDTPTPVRVEAAALLVARGEGFRLPEKLLAIPEQARVEIVHALVTEVEVLAINADASALQRAKNAAYALLPLVHDPHYRERLARVMQQWLQTDEHFWQAHGSRSDASALQVLAALERGALPLLESALVAQLEALEGLPRSQLNAAQRRQRTVIGQRLEYLIEALSGLPSRVVDDLIVDHVTKTVEAFQPQVPAALATVLDAEPPRRPNRAGKLLALARRILRDAASDDLDTLRVKERIVERYFRYAQPEEGTVTCLALMAQDGARHLRWRCVDVLTALDPEQGLSRALEALPNTPGAVLMTADHPRASGHIGGASVYLWSEVASLCGRLAETLGTEALLAQLGPYHVPSRRAIERLVAVQCLIQLNTPQAHVILDQYRGDTLALAPWALGDRSLGAWITDVRSTSRQFVEPDE